MESIEERALSYARMADCRDRREMELAKLDYIAGAKEEHILLTEWRKASELLPQVGLNVLCKTDGGDIYIGCKRADGSWKLIGTALIGEDRYITWRPIHECELPKYYGDDDSRAE